MASLLLRKTLRFMLWFIGIIVAIVVLAIGFTKVHPVFGGSPDSVSQERIKASNNHNGEVFVNLEKTATMTQQQDPLAWKGQKTGMMGMLFPADDKNPTSALPSTAFNKESLRPGSFAWLGHSTLIMNVDGQNIIIDPVFYRASPIFIGGKAFEMKEKPIIDDLPNLDFVIISHDHYDHLDAKALKEMDSKVGRYLVPLGIKAHLVKWGVKGEKVQEFDWYESAKFKDIKFTLTPSRHFSGRGIFGRNTTLWGSWIVKGGTQNIYLSGDGGYSTEFAKIGERFGPFDIAFLESGAYNGNWAEIHMFPEQSVQAGIDVKAKVLFPIHWGKFDLANHHWKEPIERFTNFAQQHNQQVATPIIGQVFDLENLPKDKWWK